MATIWLVDDDEVDGLVFVRAAAAVAPEVDVVVMETAEQCLERIDAGETSALVLIDWHLPPAGGIALLSFVVEHTAIPALVLSGSEAPEDRRAAMAVGARDWVVKPTAPAEIRRVIRETLDTHLVDSARYGELVEALQRAIVSGDDRAALATGGELLAEFERLWPDNRAGYVALASQVVAIDARTNPQRAADEASRLLEMLDEIETDGAGLPSRMTAFAALAGVLEQWGWSRAAELFERAADLADGVPELEGLGDAYRQKAAVLSQTE